MKYRSGPKMSRYVAAVSSARSRCPATSWTPISEDRHPERQSRPSACFGQQLLVHPRPVVEALEVGRRHELEQVAVPGLVLGEQGEVVVLLLALPGVRSNREPGAT
jgi:hypothetical protein